MEKALFLADPQIPCAVPVDAMHFAWHRTDRSEPAIFQEGNSQARGCPNLTPIILKQRLDEIVRQSTSGYGLSACLTVDRNTAIIPAVQAIIRAQPHAAIPGREDGLHGGIRQTLLQRNRWYSELAKAVEAIQRGDPDVALTILKKVLDVIAGEAVGAFKHIRSSLMHVDQPPI